MTTYELKIKVYDKKIISKNLEAKDLNALLKKLIADYRPLKNLSYIKVVSKGRVLGTLTLGGNYAFEPIWHQGSEGRPTKPLNVDGTAYVPKPRYWLLESDFKQYEQAGESFTTMVEARKDAYQWFQSLRNPGVSIAIIRSEFRPVFGMKEIGWITRKGGSILWTQSNNDNSYILNRDGTLGKRIR